jgi:hypothetical protein
VSFADKPSPTPTQDVFQWLQWYPQDLPNAATLTTPSLRNGLSKQAWIEQNTPLLNDLQFTYLDAKVWEEEHDGVTASVTMQVRLYLLVGEVRQVETYALKRVEGHWRIDAQEIHDDRVIGRTV